MGKKVCLFGASGTLGNKIFHELVKNDFFVITASSQANSKFAINTSNENWIESLSELGKLDGIIWAQGFNKSDSIVSFSQDVLNKHFDANISYIINTLNSILRANLLNRKARLVILSSIWQENSRAQKLSYMITKSAIRGLADSLVLDLGKFEIAVNTILPGVIDTPMTRENLNEIQIKNIVSETPLGALASGEDVARITRWLVSDDSKGINGQFITIDNGWSKFRNV